MTRAEFEPVIALFKPSQLVANSNRQSMLCVCSVDLIAFKTFFSQEISALVREGMKYVLCRITMTEMDFIFIS